MIDESTSSAWHCNYWVPPLSIHQFDLICASCITREYCAEFHPSSTQVAVPVYCTLLCTSCNMYEFPSNPYLSTNSLDFYSFIVWAVLHTFALSMFSYWPPKLGCHCNLLSSVAVYMVPLILTICPINTSQLDNPTLHIFPHQWYVGWSCVLNCFMLSSLPCFYAFSWSAIPTSCYIFNVFYSCSWLFFFSSRRMLELKFAIYYRAASLPSQASYTVLAEESQGLFKHSSHTSSISNSEILCNNYISVLSDLWACVHVKKKWHR